MKVPACHCEVCNATLTLARRIRSASMQSIQKPRPVPVCYSHFGGCSEAGHRRAQLGSDGPELYGELAGDRRPARSHCPFELTNHPKVRTMCAAFLMRRNDGARFTIRSAEGSSSRRTSCPGAFRAERRRRTGTTDCCFRLPSIRPSAPWARPLFVARKILLPPA